MQGSTVTVNNLDGSLVEAFTCNEAEAVIPTAGMQARIYVYTVTRNGKVITSGKMIIE